MHDAFETKMCSDLSWPQFTPRTTVKSMSFPGAEIMTRFAPALMCLPAPSRSRNTPVHSKTMSTPRSAQGRFSGSRSLKCLKVMSPTRTPSSVHSGFFFQVPKFESYFNKCTDVSLSEGSLIATSSNWSLKLSRMIRQTARPILPKPFIATFVFILLRLEIWGFDFKIAISIMWRRK